MIAQITERQDNIEAMLANPEADLTDEDGENPKRRRDRTGNRRP